MDRLARRKKIVKKIIRFAISLCLIVTVMVTASGCNMGKYADLDESKPLIVTTLFPQYDFARQLVKDKAEVVLLLSPGVEAHDFEPTPSDIILINKADLFIYTGDDMEPWVSRILDSIDNEELTILNVGKGVETICEDENREHNHVHEENNNIDNEDEEAHDDGHIENEHMEDVHSEEDDEHDEHDDSHNENVILGSDEHAGHDHSHSADPHIWTSPVNAIQMVENIEEALVKIDNQNAEFYKENAHEYIHALEALDSKFREVVSNSDSKTIYFGGRFAMSYFAHEYDLNYVAAFDSCQAKSEPSAKLIVKIIDMMRQNNVRIVLHEEMTDPKAARIIAEEIEGEALLLHSCHNVSKAEMEAGVTYLSLMEQNVANLQRALNK